MKIDAIAIQNFKSFKDKEVIQVEGKNLLIFGNNGSGKSSLHYALHVFFQSSLPNQNYKKYFDPENDENLLNIYTNIEESPYLIELEIKKTDGTPVKYQLKEKIDDESFSSTHQDIKLSDFASDFISHRQLFRFYSFRNSQEPNIWSLFEKEVFPYWKDDNGNSLSELLNNLNKEFYELSQVKMTKVDESGKEQNIENKYNKNSPEYKAFQSKVTEFNNKFWKFYESIKGGINNIINEFLPNEKLDVELEYKTPLDTDSKYEWEWNKPELNIKMKANGIKIPKPHVFFNEGRLTALALAIRLAMFERKYKGSDGDVIKLLVLDDLLISLDMSFRLQLLNYIQQQMKEEGSFHGYQLFIFTHDKGLFEILKDNLAQDEKKWKWFEFYENNKYPIKSNYEYKNPIIIEKLSFIKLAEHHLSGVYKTGATGKRITVYEKSYDLCALNLRKATEQILRKFYDPDTKHLYRFKVLENLERGLSNIEKEYNQKMETAFKEIFNSSKFEIKYLEELKKLQLPTDITTDVDEKKILSNVNSYKNSLFTYLIEYYKEYDKIQSEKADLIKLGKTLQEIRARILNEGAHANENPIFELELRGALDKIKEFSELVLKINQRYNK